MKKFKNILVGLGMCCILALVFGAAPALAGSLPDRPVLTIEAAEKMALACDAYAKEKGWKLNIAVLDAGGLVDREQERRDPELVDEEVRDADPRRAWLGQRVARVRRRRGRQRNSA